MNLLLVEHDYQVEDFLRRFGSDSAQWIALGPSAMHCLSERAIPFCIPEDYCSREEVEMACVDQFERLSSVCRKLDAVLLKEDPFCREWGIRPLFFHLWQLGQLVDGLVSRGLLLMKILECFSGATIYIHSGPPQPWSGHGIGFSQRETLFGRLMALPGWNIDVHTLPQVRAHIEKKVFNELPIYDGFLFNIKKRLSGFTRRDPLLWSLVQSLLSRRKNNIGNIFKHRILKRGVAIALLNGVYEWASVLPSLVANGYPVYFVSGPDLKKAISSTNEMKHRLNLASALWEDFKNGLSQTPVKHLEIIRDRFEYIVEYSPIIARRIINYLEVFSRKNKIGALVTCVGADFASCVIKQFYRRNNIKVFSWQHGAEWYDKRITQRNDLLNLVNCDKMMVYGEGVKFAYEASSLAKEEKCEVVSVGMPSLHALRDISTQSDSKITRILWPFGGYYGNHWYCGFSPPQNDRIYYKEQMIIVKNLLSLLKRYPHLSITIKLLVSNFLPNNPPWVADLPKLNRIRIVYYRPDFVELLDEHDAVIIDSPTTTLLQAIATRLPVFVLMSVIRWPDEEIDLLKRRAYCTKDVREMMVNVGNYVEDGIYHGNVENNDFLRKYGIDEFNSVNRAAFLVKSSLKEIEAKWQEP